MSRYLAGNKEIKDTVINWPGIQNGQIDDLIKCLYIVGAIGMIRDTDEEAYLPISYERSDRIILSPMLRPAILGYTHPAANDFAAETIQNAVDFLVESIDIFTIAVGISGNISPEQGGESLFEPRRIRYSFARLLWGIRALYKRLLAYGDAKRVNSVINVFSVLSVINNAYDKLSYLAKMDQSKMDTLSILMNNFDGEPISEDVFRSSIDEKQENIYIECISQVNLLIGELQIQETKIKLQKEIKELLSTLRTVVAGIDLDNTQQQQQAVR